MVKLKMMSPATMFKLMSIRQSTSSKGKLPGANLEFQYNSSAKRWMHDDADLINNKVVYPVKFLGSVEVDHPKGLDVVRESIKKLEFQEHLKRAAGEKIKSIDLNISIDGISICEPKKKIVIHEFPLHRISYCADDKSERKYLSFIAKIEKDSIRHECFVFVSEKLSEEITLTIGQAFDLAYKKFLDSVNEFDAKKELIQARRKIYELEYKVTELEHKLEQFTSAPKIPPLKPSIVKNPKSHPTIDLTLTTKKLASSMQQEEENTKTEELI